MSAATAARAAEPRSEFPIDRRSLIGSAAFGAAALALPGCVTTPRPEVASKPSLCLPPVNVSPDRVVRTVAGLRPYRDSGFVVRAEQLGPTRLVHNYGHGGAGVTLSWGSSRLAVDIGLQGHSGPVAVIGSGILGLSTARLVQEAGFPVTIYAADLPPNTTSNLSGGQWHPFGHFSEGSVTPEWRQQFRSASDYSWRRFKLMVGEDYGVRWLPTYTQGGPEEPFIPDFPPVNRALAYDEHPFPIERMTRYDTLYVEMGRYLRRMMQDIVGAGGNILVRRFVSPSEIAALPERLVFNCTGLGARELFGDQELRPARGQLAILPPQAEVRYAFTGRAGYMFSRPDAILLGGSFELDEWSTTPNPATISRIVASHRRLFESLRCTA